MAETQLPDLFLPPSLFRTAWNSELVVRKENRIATTTPADARRKPIAQWGNLLDGLLLRLNEQVSGAARSVRVYGAIGDGVTDDTNAIQAAIDAVEAAGGGVVFFPIGTYLHEGFTPAEGVRLVYLTGGNPNDEALLGADGDIAVAVIGATPLYVKTGGTGTTGWTAIGGGDVALADLPDAAARSVLGRAANTAGVLADIEGQGAGTVLHDDGSTLEFRSLSLLTFQDTVFYEVDFAALAANAFVNGAETIDGLPWVTAGSANAGATWGLNGTTGLVHTTPANLTSTFDSSGQTAAQAYIELGSIPNWVPGYPLFVDVHIPSSTYEQNTDRCVFGLWSPSGSPDTGAGHVMRLGAKGLLSGDITNGVQQQTTVTGAADAHNLTAFSVRIDPAGDVLCGHGTWSSGWPAANGWTYNVGANASITAGPNGLSAPTCRLVLAFVINADASPTTTTTIANLRVRRG